MIRKSMWIEIVRMWTQNNVYQSICEQKTKWIRCGINGRFFRFFICEHALSLLLHQLSTADSTPLHQQTIYCLLLIEHYFISYLLLIVLSYCKRVETFSLWKSDDRFTRKELNFTLCKGNLIHSHSNRVNLDEVSLENSKITFFHSLFGNKRIHYLTL